MKFRNRIARAIPGRRLTAHTSAGVQEQIHGSRPIALAVVSSLLIACAHAPNEDQLFIEPLPAAQVRPYGDDDQDRVANYLDDCAATPATTQVGASGCSPDSDGDGVPDYRDRCADTRPGAAACRFGCKLVDPHVFNLVNDEFEFDKAVLLPHMIEALDAYADTLRTMQGPIELTIVGHTDNYGTVAYNQGLSERRAKAVQTYLQSLNLEHVSATTRGESENQPVDTNETPEGRARNRRVEIFLHSHGRADGYRQ